MHKSKIHRHCFSVFMVDFKKYLPNKLCKLCSIFQMLKLQCEIFYISPVALRIFNDRLIQMEKGFIYVDGLPGRPYLKQVKKVNVFRKFICSKHLHVQKQQQKVQKNVWNMFKVNSKDSRMISPAGNYMFKVKNRNTRRRCEICSKILASFWCLYW